MKTWMITLPFLFAAGLATAADPAPAPATPKPEAAAAPKAAAAPEAAKPAEAAKAVEAPKPATAAKSKRHKARHLPHGDLRQCLELKDSKAIIRCAETGRKK